MTGFPQVTVELALTTVPSSTTPSWTDITPYVSMVDGLSWSHGRPDEYSQTQPGALTMVWENIDGRFTVGNTSGAYWPNMKVGKRIRFSVTVGGITYRRYDGFINEPEVFWNGANYSQVRVTATDRFGKFGRARKLRSLLQEEVLYDGPVAYWPLGEPAGSAIAADVSGVQTNLIATRQGIGGAVTFASGVGPPGDSLPAVVFAPNDNDNGAYLRARNITGAVASGTSTMECWFLCTVADPLSAETVMGATFNDRQSHMRMLIVAAGGLRFVANSFDAAGNVATAQVGTSASMVDGHLHHAVGVATLTATSVVVTLYVDGALVGSQTTVTSGMTVPTVIVDAAVGAMPPRYGTPALGMFTGTVAHAAIWGKAVTAAQAFNHSLGGKTGFAGEKTDRRIARLARYTGVIDASLLALDVGASGIASQATDGTDVLSAMQEATAAEDGQLYMSGDGKLTLHARWRRYSLTPAFTLHSNNDDYDPALTFAPSQQFVINDATYSRPGGAEQRAINAASIADMDTYGDQQTYVLTTDDEVLSRASWRVNIRGTPLQRCAQVKVDLLTQSSSALIAAVLAADVSTRFTTDQLPSQAPASSIDLVIEGLTETLSITEWSVTFNTSPASTLANIWQFNSVTTFPLTFGT